MLADAVAMYLSRLGLPGNLAPTAQTLAQLQRRHQDAVPYENLAIMLGRPDSTDPVQTLERIAAGGNAGYCFHHKRRIRGRAACPGVRGGAPVRPGAGPHDPAA